MSLTTMAGRIPTFTGSGLTLTSPYLVGSPSDSGVPIASQPTLSGLRLGGYNLREAHLTPPALVSKTLQQTLTLELQHQLTHPPALPRSQIPALPPKPRARDWFTFPEGIDATRRRDLEEKNNAIAAENQAVERDRNNMAAKKSRQVRLEALQNARAMLNEKAAECAWFRLRVAMLGGNPADEWDAVPRAVKASMIEEIAQRVAVIDARNAEEKKREEARKRATDGPRGPPAKRQRSQRSTSRTLSERSELENEE